MVCDAVHYEDSVKQLERSPLCTIKNVMDCDAVHYEDAVKQLERSPL